jgi:glycerol kinase
VQDTGGLTLVPAFTGLGSPYWDAHARGALLGITRGTNRAHIARAALEAIALQSAELLEAMRNDSDLAVTELRVDGGAAANDLLMQMQADLLQVPVVRPAVGETTAQGAADLALLGAQVFQKSEDLRLARAKNAAETTFYPQATPAWAEERMSSWRAAIGRVLTRQR